MQCNVSYGFLLPLHRHPCDAAVCIDLNAFTENRNQSWPALFLLHHLIIQCCLLDSFLIYSIVFFFSISLYIRMTK